MRVVFMLLKVCILTNVLCQTQKLTKFLPSISPPRTLLVTEADVT
jgi:hypothetical protein